MAKQIQRKLWRSRNPSSAIPKPARQIVRSTGGIVRGKFPSRKNSCMVHHEGLLELDAMYLFEWSQRIARYRGQPITMPYPDGAVLRHYTPDFELGLIDGTTVLIEIKPTASLQHSDVAHKLACISQHLECSQQRFEIVTDQVIRLQPRLNNLKQIYHGAMRFPVSTASLSAGLQRLTNKFPMCLHELSERLTNERMTPFCLLLAGLIHLDLDQTLTQNTTLHLTDEVTHVFFFSQKEFGF